MRSARRGAPRKKVVWGGRVRLMVALVGAAALSSSCGNLREGTASSYLVLTSLTATPGGGGAGGTNLLSDVLTVVAGVPTIFNDVGTADFRLVMKDTTVAPTDVNAITLTQYRVVYTRTDGHNVQGVDVPYAFDGALTATISGTGSVGFTIVRHSAKEEAPLRGLVNSSEPLTTIATVTFYGHDQTGREVSVSGGITITFWNFADTGR